MPGNKFIFAENVDTDYLKSVTSLIEQEGEDGKIYLTSAFSAIF